LANRENVLTLFLWLIHFRIMKRPLLYTIVALLVLRTGVSLILSDGRLRSDSIAYFGVVVNLHLNGSAAAILTEEDKRFPEGTDINELFNYLSVLPNPTYRPLAFQWFHSVLYTPLLLLWKSLTPIILINNLLFLGAGIFFFRAVAPDASLKARYIGWIVYALFPPFFYLTSQFLSEPLFIFLLGTLVFLIEKQGKRQLLLLILAAAALCLTRPFGIIVVIALAGMSTIRTNHTKTIGLLTALVLAVAINAIVMKDAIPENANIFSVSLPETFYCTNTTNGNGDFDYYFVVPKEAQNDTVLQQYRAGITTGSALMLEACLQNYHAPQIFAVNSLNKLSNYFFSIVPEQWIYSGTPPQPFFKKIVWLIHNLALFALIITGVWHARRSTVNLYCLLFIVGLIIHFLLLARYRYFLPLLVYGTAFIPLAFEKAHSLPQKLRYLSSKKF